MSVSTPIICRWPVAKSDAPNVCGSKYRLYNVKGELFLIPICEKHLPEAWHRWNCETAEPIAAGATEEIDACGCC